MSLSVFFWPESNSSYGVKQLKAIKRTPFVWKLREIQRSECTNKVLLAHSSTHWFLESLCHHLWALLDDLSSRTEAKVITLEVSTSWDLTCQPCSVCQAFPRSSVFLQMIHFNTCKQSLCAVDSPALSPLWCRYSTVSHSLELRHCLLLSYFLAADNLVHQDPLCTSHVCKVCLCKQEGV